MTSPIVVTAGSSCSSSIMRSCVRRFVTIEFFDSLPSLVSSHAAPLGWSQNLLV